MNSLHDGRSGGTEINDTSKLDITPFSLQMEELAALARDLGARGWTPATSGNYSIRLDAHHLAITRSGTDKRKLRIDDLMVVDLDGRPLDAGRPSAETLLHTQLYRLSTDIGAVLHVHSPVVTVASRLAVEDAEIRLSGYELLKAFEGITTHEIEIAVPVLPNRQDIAELARLVAPHLEGPAPRFAYLIDGHGVYAWGSDLDAAARHLDAIDFLLACHLEERRLRP